MRKVQRSSDRLVLVLLAGAVFGAVGCASAKVKPPSAPLSSAETAWPEDVADEAAKADRLCGTKESKLLFRYQEGKEQQEGFKTILGSITGGVGTAGGVITGVGAFVIDDQDTKETMTGVTGFVTAGLGAVGSIVTAVVSPGKSKMTDSAVGLEDIDKKKEKARAALTKDPASWSDADKEAWSSAVKDLEASCSK
ncbi:MAG: hypothetical protein U0414_26925 [Polyangiaceae bacterium]